MYQEQRDFPEMPTLSAEFLIDLVDYGKAGATRDEILEGFSMRWEDLIETEQVYFTQQLNYGKILGLRIMSDNLFAQARQKGGAIAALAYLKRFSSDWQSEDTSADGNFTFNFTNP